ncbi:MAG: hypothetical protein LKM31_08915 [Sphingobium sp.]|nr:hypothetical protein [Sphingobium sp.]
MSAQTMPAMSRCAQGDALVDEALDELRRGDRAAEARGPVFFMSAIGLSISLS